MNNEQIKQFIKENYLKGSEIDKSLFEGMNKEDITKIVFLTLLSTRNYCINESNGELSFDQIIDNTSENLM